jgi:L-ascorbate metabolism protein UlaG (beta-lactamase superfamily)
MKLTWITQAGFIFEAGGIRIVVDPYLSDVAEKKLGFTRLVDPPFSVPQLKPTAIFCTHDHVDHLDPLIIPKIADCYPDCVFIGPPSVMKSLRTIGVSEARIRKLVRGEQTQVGLIRLTATPAFHTDSYAVGLFVETQEYLIYLSGDTLNSPGLEMEIRHLANRRIDAAIICVNGRLGNMGGDDALQLVKGIKPRAAIPMHYGLFAENTVDPIPFVTSCRKAGFIATILPVGLSVSIEDLLAGRLP